MSYIRSLFCKISSLDFGLSKKRLRRQSDWQTTQPTARTLDYKIHIVNRMVCSVLCQENVLLLFHYV